MKAYLTLEGEKGDSSFKLSSPNIGNPVIVTSSCSSQNEYHSLTNHSPYKQDKIKKDKQKWKQLKGSKSYGKHDDTPFLSSLCPLAIARRSFLFFPTTWDMS